MTLPPNGAPQRQFVFIRDGRLQEAPTVRHLLRFLQPVGIEDRCHDVLDRFLADDATYALPVVDVAGRPVAMPSGGDTWWRCC